MSNRVSVICRSSWGAVQLTFTSDPPIWKDGTKREDYSLQWLVMSQIMKPELLRLFGNKGLKVTDKQCGPSVCRCVIKLCCVCVFPRLPLRVWLFLGALCTECTKRPSSGRNNSVLGFYERLEQCLYWWQSDRKKERAKRQTVQQMRQRQICNYYLVTINIIHRHK